MSWNKLHKRAQLETSLREKFGHQFEQFVLVPSRYGDGYDLYGIGVYPESSVNAGMEMRSFLDSFETLEEAQGAYPDVEVWQGLGPAPELPKTPPDWFDPMDAGERWDEDY